MELRVQRNKPSASLAESGNQNYQKTKTKQKKPNTTRPWFVFVGFRCGDAAVQPNPETRVLPHQREGLCPLRTDRLPTALHCCTGKAATAHGTGTEDGLGTHQEPWGSGGLGGCSEETGGRGRQETQAQSRPWTGAGGD